MFNLRADKNFRVSLKKYVDQGLDDVLGGLFLDFNKYFDIWANDIKQALSVPAPEADRVRWSATRDRRRRFPYERTGELKDSLRFKLDHHRTQKSMVIKASVGFTSDHAYYTDQGIRSPKYVADGAWVGWAKDLFLGNGRDGVQGVRALFDEFTKRRRAI